MRVLDALRRALGSSQQELARRMERSQPTVARMLSQGEHPTLASLEQLLRALGLRGRLAIEVGESVGEALAVEVQGEPLPARRARRSTQRADPSAEQPA